MTTEEARTVQPQGQWVRDIVSDLTERQESERQESPPRRAAPDDHSPVEPADAGPGPGLEAPAPEAPAPDDVTADATATGGPNTVDRPAPVHPRPAIRRQHDGLIRAFDETLIGARPRHGESGARRVGRWLQNLTRAGQRDTQLTELLGSIRRPVTTGRRIAVAGVRGGVGTTTIALLVASVLAGRRDDQVLAVDGDDELASLSWRAGVDPVPPPSDARSLSTLAALDAAVPKTDGGLWVLPAGADHRTLGRFFGVTVLDCGDELVAGTTSDDGLDSAHAVILVASATVDGVRAAHLAIDALSPLRHQVLGAVSRPVVALVSRTPHDEGLDVGAARRFLEQLGPRVVHVPYDRQLAAGGRLQLSRLSDSTLLAVTDLGGRVLELARAESASA